MIFGAFSDDELRDLRKDAKTFLKTGNLCRGSDFQPWNRGQMKPVGSRQPAGGRTGDTYTVYRGMEIELGDVEKVKQLFRHAKVRNELWLYYLRNINITRMWRWWWPRFSPMHLVWCRS
jgi:hypothetical protein